MHSLIDNSELTINCKKCTAKTAKAISWLKTHKKLRCTCGALITLNQTQLKADIANLEASFSNLLNTIHTAQNQA